MDAQLEYIGRQLRDGAVSILPIHKSIADRVVRTLGFGVATVVPYLYLPNQLGALLVANGITLIGSEYCFLLEHEKSDMLRLETEKNKNNLIGYRIFLLALFGILPTLNGVLSPGNLIWLYAYFAIDTRNHSGKKAISEWLKKQIGNLKLSLPQPQTV